MKTQTPHPFLLQFAIQWYKTARAHKEAFPYRIETVKNDAVRIDLIRILDEEYGNGDIQKTHANLLFKFLHALNVAKKEIERTKTDPPAEQFSQAVLRG